jgi:hypothetical protein
VVNSLTPGNHGVENIEMINVVERVGQDIDQQNHPESMTVFKLGCDHSTPPASC